MTAEPADGADPRTSPSPEELHVDALDRLGQIIHAASGSELGNPTPCADWNVRQVIEHTAGLKDGFAEDLARGTATEVAYGPRPLAEWPDSVTAVRRALASVAGDDGLCVIAPVGDELAFAKADAVRMQLLDLVVHTWDVAAVPGVAHTPTVAAIAAITEMAAMIAARPLPSTMEQFADALEPADDDPWTQVLRLLGRDPGWPAAMSRPHPAVATP